MASLARTPWLTLCMVYASAFQLHGPSRLSRPSLLSRQVEGEGVLVSPRFLELHRELWARQQAALRRAQPEVVQQAAAAKQVRLAVALLSPSDASPLTGCLQHHDLQGY